MRPWFIRALAVAALALLALAGCVVKPEQPATFPVRAVITPGAPVTPYPRSQVDYGGIYQFFDVRGSAPSPYQDGSHQIIPWHLLEPTVGNYNWSELDSYVADRAGYGLHIGLGFNTVDYSPYHCASVGGSQCWAGDDREDRVWLPADMLQPQDQGVTYVVCPLDSTYPRHRLPKYWSAQYLAAYEDFVDALAAHIDSTPALQDNIDWIELPIGVYGELNPGVSQDSACLQELGLTQALWETTVEQMIDIWVDAFAGSGIDLSFQGTNYYLDKGNRQRMNDYAAGQGLGLQHAKWHPDWEDMAVACASCWSRGKGMVDASLRWENQVTFAIEYPDPPLWGEGNRTTLNHAEEDYWNLAAFLDLKGDMYKARLYPRGTLARLTTENPYVVGMIQTVRDLAGKDEGNAPYAVVWMRETEWGWWPKCNNFDFYLYASTAQEPRVGSSCPGLSALTTDGQAVAVYNLDATYAPGLCPNDRVYSATCDPRYRYARETAAGQPYIYLDVDPKYRYGTGVNATVSIDYLDVGTDEIRFQWHNGSAVQTESRAKTNTRQWRTWTLSLANMDLTDRFTSGSTAWDFRLWDGGDGVETIHSVKLQPSNGGTVPATPTPTPTVTATPTVLAGPWRMRVDPASHQWRDALIWLRNPSNTYASLPTYALRASSDDAFYVPTYNTTVASLLVEVAFDLPPNTTLNHATLYMYPTGGYLNNPMTLVLRPVVAEWALPSWRYRINPDPGVGGAAVPWATPGAYGAGDVGAPFGSVRITSDDIDASLPIALDVGGAVQAGGGLALKIEPWCVCSNPVTTDNVPDGVISSDSAVELFNSSSEPLDLSLYRLCVNTTCLWLEGTIQPFGYKVWYQQWDGLDFVEGGANTVRLYRAGESPLVLVDTLAIQSQTADHCWAAVTDASPVYVQKYPPTLGRGNNWFE